MIQMNALIDLNQIIRCCNVFVGFRLSEMRDRNALQRREPSLALLATLSSNAHILSKTGGMAILHCMSIGPSLRSAALFTSQPTFHLFAF